MRQARVHPPHGSPGPSGRARRGLTLVELLMALAITAMVGLAIASMLFAVSRGTASSQDMRGLVVKHKALDARLAAAIRSSRKVLATGSNCIVLWMADTRADGVPDLSELRRIEVDNTGSLVSYSASFPANWSQAAIDAADTSYPLNSDFLTVTSGLKSNSLFPSTKWMTGVTAITFTLNNATAQSANLVSYRATVTSGSQSAVPVGAATLRN